MGGKGVNSYTQNDVSRGVAEKYTDNTETVTISGSVNACSAFVRRIIDFSVDHVIYPDLNDKTYSIKFWHDLHQNSCYIRITLTSNRK